MPRLPGSDTSASASPSDQPAALIFTLESGRDLLARRLVQDHHTVTDPDLNYLTVSSLFQILFLKTGQECGFVEPGTLAALAGCDGIARRMARACSDAGLVPEAFFERGPEGSRQFPSLSDDPLRGIIGRMDTTAIPAPVARLSPEEFATVLETFLGIRMQLGEGCRVNRIGKSALLYTGSVDVPPQEIVEHVVSNAAAGLSGRSAMGGEPPCRILDMACGSGLFLLAAYRFLVRKNTRSHDRPEEILAILQNLSGGSVFGTDIDPESVSAARLVLLFAFLDESRCAGSAITPGIIRDVCTCLTKTVRCGNALIAPDYFSGKPVFPFNADERRKVNPLSWQETFPEIPAEGGFDAVIGAPPPYRPFAVPAREEYFQTHYDAYALSAGLYGYFIERALSLLKPGGKITVLVPGTFLRSQNARPLRRLLLSRQIESIASTGRTRHLPDGEVPVYALSLKNHPPDRPFVVAPDRAGTRNFTLDQRLLGDGGWILEDTRTDDILEKIQRWGTPLDHYILEDIEAGIHQVRNNPFVLDRATKTRLLKNAGWCRHFFIPLLRPADIRRYVPDRPEKFILLIRDPRDLRKCRALVTYLEHVLSDRGRTSPRDGILENTDPASGLSIIHPESEEIRPKIIFPPYQDRPSFCYDPDGTYAITDTLFAIPRNDPFLLGILNSALARFVLTRTCPLTKRGYHISPAAVGRFPVYVTDFEKLADRTRHNKMVSLVTHILELNHYLPQAKTDQERRLVQQDLDATEVRIDALVYEMYGLTPEEIAVVESGFPS